MAAGRGFQLGGCSPSDVSTDPSTTARQHQPSDALAREDGLGTTNDGCGQSVDQLQKQYRPIKGVGWRRSVVVRGWWVVKRTRFEFELN